MPQPVERQARDVVTPETTVVLSSEGALVTVWTREDYDDGMLRLLADAGYA